MSIINNKDKIRLCDRQKQTVININKSYAVAEMAAQGCPTRIVKIRRGSVFGKKKLREKRVSAVMNRNDSVEK